MVGHRGSQLGIMPKPVFRIVSVEMQCYHLWVLDTRTCAFASPESWSPHVITVAKDPLLSWKTSPCVVVSECWGLSYMPVVVKGAGKTCLALKEVGL